MTDTPEMIEWLDRIILGSETTKGHGKRATRKALMNIGEARHLLYEDLGYDITRKQFEGLRDAQNYELGIKEEQIRYRVIKHDKPTGQVHYRQVFRDVYGRFAKKPNT